MNAAANRPPPGPLAAYRARLKAGDLGADPAQDLAAEKLEALHRALATYDPGEGKGWRAKLGFRRRAAPAPRGLYLHGGVGRGKSMLMDMFFDRAPIEVKRRVHFHAFMAEVHDRLHRLREAAGAGGVEPMAPLADGIAAEARLLCFDEFQVTNIADAMILGRLFAALFERGVIVVATSNVAPDELYKDGLQRERFEPFIALLKERLDVLRLDGGADHRLKGRRRTKVYHAPLGRAADDALDQAFGDLTQNAPSRAATLTVKGRKLKVKAAAKGVARFEFSDLCAANLGAVDYLAIARAYHTLVLSGVPRMPPDARNEARRFMTLIDALYEHRVKLVLSADGPPEALYPKGPGAEEFRRAVSRLHEMQSAEYLGAAHKP